MSSALAYFAYGFFTALVMVLVAGGISAFLGRNQSRKITRPERRFSSWHKRSSDKPPEEGPPYSGGSTGRGLRNQDHVDLAGRMADRGQSMGVRRILWQHQNRRWSIGRLGGVGERLGRRGTGTGVSSSHAPHGATIEMVDFALGVV